MSATRPPSRAPGAIAVALLLSAALTAGCGHSAPRPASAPDSASASASATASSPPSATSPDPAGRRTAPGGTPGARPDASRRPAGKPSAAAGGVPSGSPNSIPPAHPVPAAFRPAAGAPSDAEVRRELALMGAIQRRQRQQELSAAAANLAGLLPWSLEPRSGIRVSVASVFRDYGLGLACGGVLGREQLGVAHKTAPCGTPITFTYAGRSLTVPVIDRGPYIVGREWDLTGATAEALGFPGLGRIEWSVAA